MRAVLGIFDGVHDAGAALVLDGALVAAASEERFTRTKCQGGWPEQSIAAVLQTAGVSRAEIDAVAFAGLVNPNPVLRALRPVQRRFRLDDGFYPQATGSTRDTLLSALHFASPFPKMRSDSRAVRLTRPALRAVLRRQLRDEGIQAPLELHDHHRCHAAVAHLCSGFDRPLVVIADGIGDGLSLSVWDGPERIGAWPFPHSYGLLYATVCSSFGFRPFRHEGKLVGLAGRGDADAVGTAWPFEGPVDGRKRVGALGVVPQGLETHRREDICAWLQRGIETDLCALVQHASGGRPRKLALAGGVFANVKLNQALAELDCVDELFVFPHMGDGGLCAGAALLTAGARPQTLPHVFLGPAPSDGACEAALVGTSYTRPPSVEKAVAGLLAAGKIVGRFEGALEFGPRALGHRTVLAPATDPGVTDELNARLKRSDFMPFAPAILAEEVAGWMDVSPKVAHACSFMTVAVDTTAQMAQRLPAAVHVDGTARPQVVHADTSPSFHAILKAYHAETGLPSCINTSFNRHEEPIVATPADAVHAFREAKLDALALGPFLLRR